MTGLAVDSDRFYLFGAGLYAVGRQESAPAEQVDTATRDFALIDIRLGLAAGDSGLVVYRCPAYGPLEAIGTLDTEAYRAVCRLDTGTLLAVTDGGDLHGIRLGAGSAPEVFVRHAGEILAKRGVLVAFAKRLHE